MVAPLHEVDFLDDDEARHGREHQVLRLTRRASGA